MFHQDIPEGLPESPLHVKYHLVVEVASLYLEYHDRRIQRLYDSYSEEEWTALAGRPATETIQRESKIDIFAEKLSHCRSLVSASRAVWKYDRQVRRSDDVDLDPELDAKCEAAIDRLFEWDAEVKHSKAIRAESGDENPLPSHVKFTPADEAQRKHYQSKGGFLGLVYEGDRKFITEEEARGTLSKTLAYLKRKATQSKEDQSATSPFLRTPPSDPP